MTKKNDLNFTGSKKNEELELKLRELREEKTRLTEAFIAGKIPQDIYKKTVTRMQKETIKIENQIKQRTSKK